MQTFLPHPSFARSAAALDDRRLGKQRVEALQILRALHLEDYGWARHPAVLMWRGCTRALVAYGLAVVDEWRARGHGDATAPSIAEFALPRPALPVTRLPASEVPPWLGWTALHRSHQSALVRKDPAFYRPLFPGTPPDLGYVWPEPPAGEAPRRPLAAWVLRADTASRLAVFRQRAIVGLPAALEAPKATRKQRAQLRRLRETARVGDRVAVPDGAGLRCGALTSPPAQTDVDGAPFVVRTVAWDRRVPRSALRRPYQLQDPQLMFALRGEPAVAD